MARKFRPPIPFPTGRRSRGTYRVGVFISDQLIIENTHPEGATGGVGRWASTFANRVKAEAIAISPTGDERDHFHDFAYKGGYPWGGPGTYKRSFMIEKSGNQHKRRRRIGNFAPHAIFVESGRAPSGPALEVFTSAKADGRMVRTRNNRGWDGYDILATALENARLSGFGNKIRAQKRSVAQFLAEPKLNESVEPDGWLVE